MDILAALKQEEAKFQKQADAAKQQLSSLGEDAKVSAIFIDIDYFKSLNDQFGHAAGDQTLVDVAQVLRDWVTAADCVSRIGGEEFALLRPEGLRAAVDFAETLRTALEQPLRVAGFDLRARSLEFVPTGGRTLAIAHVVTSGNPAEVINKWGDGLRALTSEQLQQVARKYLNAANRTVIVITPAGLHGEGH